MPSIATSRRAERMASRELSSKGESGGRRRPATKSRAPSSSSARKRPSIDTTLAFQGVQPAASDARTSSIMFSNPWPCPEFNIPANPTAELLT